MRFNREWLGAARRGRASSASPPPTTWRACSSGATSGSASTPASPSPCTSSSIPLAQAYDSVALKADVELGRHRPALQPERRARHHARLRPRAAGRDDDAAPRGHGRRREDVEEPRQLHRGQRERRTTMFAKVHVHLGRADVEVLRCCSPISRRRRSRRSARRAGPWTRSSALARADRRGFPRRRRRREAAEAEWRRVHQAPAGARARCRW